jgi:lipoprotein-anchoring transpeptidase ErfK/SrfK
MKMRDSNLFRLIFVLLFITFLSVPGPTTAQAEDGNDSDSDKPPSYAESADSSESDVIVGNGAMDVIDESSEGTIEEDQDEPEKHIIVSLADQQMWVFEGDEIVQRFLVSTGRSGHATPTGSYSVHNLSPRAYSQRYECYMLQWMAITADGMFGMHALEGTSYERHLGSVASHGCIRLSHVNAEWLYVWVEIGTSVEVVADYEEPVPDKSMPYRVAKHYCY